MITTQEPVDDEVEGTDSPRWYMQLHAHVQEHHRVAIVQEVIRITQMMERRQQELKQKMKRKKKSLMINMMKHWLLSLKTDKRPFPISSDV